MSRPGETGAISDGYAGSHAPLRDDLRVVRRSRSARRCRLSALVDAIQVVCRMNVVRRPMLTELRRALHASPADKLGFVLAGAESEDGYGDGGYDYDRREEREAAGVR